MTIDSTTSLEVRPLVLQSVVENGEAVVTLAESSAIDLHTLNIQNYNYEASGANIIGSTSLTATISDDGAFKLATALFSPTVDFDDMGIQGAFSPYEVYQSGVTFGEEDQRTFRLYFKILDNPNLQLTEDGQKVVITGDYPTEPYVVISHKVSQLDNGNYVRLIPEIVMEDGVSCVKSLKFPVNDQYAAPVLNLFTAIKMDEAALLANLPQTGDIFCIQFVCRSEGYVSTPKLTNLNSPVDGTDAVNLDFVTAEVATLDASNADQIAHIDSEVAILLDKIVNQDSIEAVSTEKWTSPKAVIMEGQVQGTQVLANFNTSVSNEADQSIKIAKKSFRVINGSTSIGDPNFQLSDVNNDLAPGFYKLVVAASNQCGQFPACSYGNRGYIDPSGPSVEYQSIFDDCNDNPMTFDVRYYANQDAFNNDVYTVVATSVVSQGKIIVNAQTFPNWKQNTYSLSGPSYITVTEGTTANAGYVNTIPGFFSWTCKNLKDVGDDSPMSMWITEMPSVGNTAVILEVVDSLQISDVDPKFGTGCLVLDGGEKSFVRIMNDDKGMNFSGGNFCVEGWFKFDPANMNGSYKLFSLGNDVANDYNGQSQENPLSISIYTSSSWESIDLSYAYRNQSGQTDYLGRNVILRNGDGEGTSIVDNQWHHIALVFENGVFKVYVDGVVKVTEPTTDALDLNSYLDFSNIFIGGDTKYAGWISNMIGSVDCLRITVGAPVYTSNFTPSTTPLKFNLTGLGIAFPDMKTLSLRSNSLGVVLANPPVDTSDMTAEEFADSMRIKVYTANVVKNIVGSWQTPEGEVFVGPNGELVEEAPTSGRIIRVGKKLNTTDLLIDIQDYGFISAVTTKRKKFEFGDLEPLAPGSDPFVIEFSIKSVVDNRNDTLTYTLKTKALAVGSSAKLMKWNYDQSQFELLEDLSSLLNLSNLFGSLDGETQVVVNRLSSNGFKLVLDNGEQYPQVSEMWIYAPDSIPSDNVMTWSLGGNSFDVTTSSLSSYELTNEFDFGILNSAILSSNYNERSLLQLLNSNMEYMATVPLPFDVVDYLRANDFSGTELNLRLFANGAPTESAISNYKITGITDSTFIPLTYERNGWYPWSISRGRFSRLQIENYFHVNQTQFAIISAGDRNQEFKAKIENDLFDMPFDFRSYANNNLPFVNYSYGVNPINIDIVDANDGVTVKAQYSISGIKKFPPAPVITGGSMIGNIVNASKPAMSINWTPTVEDLQSSSMYTNILYSINNGPFFQTLYNGPWGDVNPLKIYQIYNNGWVALNPGTYSVRIKLMGNLNGLLFETDASNQFTITLTSPDSFSWAKNGGSATNVSGGLNSRVSLESTINLNTTQSAVLSSSNNQNYKVKIGSSLYAMPFNFKSYADDNLPYSNYTSGTNPLNIDVVKASDDTTVVAQYSISGIIKIPSAPVITGFNLIENVYYPNKPAFSLDWTPTSQEIDSGLLGVTHYNISFDGGTTWTNWSGPGNNPWSILNPLKVYEKYTTSWVALTPGTYPIKIKLRGSLNGNNFETSASNTLSVLLPSEFNWSLNGGAASDIPSETSSRYSLASSFTVNTTQSAILSSPNGQNYKVKIGSSLYAMPFNFKSYADDNLPYSNYTSGTNPLDIDVVSASDNTTVVAQYSISGIVKYPVPVITGYQLKNGDPGGFSFTFNPTAQELDANTIFGVQANGHSTGSMSPSLDGGLTTLTNQGPGSNSWSTMNPWTINYNRVNNQFTGILPGTYQLTARFTGTLLNSNAGFQNYTFATPVAVTVPTIFSWSVNNGAEVDVSAGMWGWWKGANDPRYSLSSSFDLSSIQSAVLSAPGGQDQYYKAKVNGVQYNMPFDVRAHIANNPSSVVDGALNIDIDSTTTGPGRGKFTITGIV